MVLGSTRRKTSALASEETPSAAAVEAAELLPPGCSLTVQLVPAHPVWDEPFKCVVALEKGTGAHAVLDYPLSVRVWVGDGDGDIREGLTVVNLSSEALADDYEPSRSGSQANGALQSGKAEFSVVLSKSAARSSTSAEFTLCAEIGGGVDVGDKVEPGRKGFKMHRYKLVEEPFQGDAGEHATDVIFYKDEGGKQKHMSAQISLVDALQDGQEVSSLTLPVEVTLLYESGQLPFQQKIMSIFNELSNLSVSSSKPATISYRIDEVSKNHAGQKFMLQVAVSESSPSAVQSGILNAGVAPCFTLPVTVLSKRKNAAARREGTNPSHKEQQVLSVAAPPRPKMTRRFVQARPSPSSSNTSTPTSISTPSQGGLKRSLPASIYSSVPQPTERVPQAMVDMVGDWVTCTLNVLEKIQWTTVGYETGFRGDVDRTRPIRRCPSCATTWDSMTLASSTPDLQPQHRQDCPLARAINSYIDNGHSAAYRLLGVRDAPLGPSLKRARLAGEDPGLLGPPALPAPSGLQSFTPLAHGRPPSGMLEHKVSVQIWLDKMESSISEERDGESDVAYALEGGLKSSTTGELYWPAFNARKYLVGFYKETTVSGMTVTSAEFVTEKDPANLGIVSSTRDLEAALNSSLAAGGAAVVSLVDAQSVANIKKRLLLSNMFVRDVFGRPPSDMELGRQTSADLEYILNEHLNGSGAISGDMSTPRLT
jgi:hypothetical protein